MLSSLRELVEQNSLPPDLPRLIGRLQVIVLVAEKSNRRAPLRVISRRSPLFVVQAWSTEFAH